MTCTLFLCDYLQSEGLFAVIILLFHPVSYDCGRLKFEHHCVYNCTSNSMVRFLQAYTVFLANQVESSIITVFFSLPRVILQVHF